MAPHSELKLLHVPVLKVRQVECCDIEYEKRRKMRGKDAQNSEIFASTASGAWYSND